VGEGKIDTVEQPIDRRQLERLKIDMANGWPVLLQENGDEAFIGVTVDLANRSGDDPSPRQGPQSICMTPMRVIALEVILERFPDGKIPLEARCARLWNALSDRAAQYVTDHKLPTTQAPSARTIQRAARDQNYENIDDALRRARESELVSA
jgi:hypothetical protein